MNPFEPTSLDSVQAFATSLAIGLLIGLERERRPDPKAGLRTFALVGLLGCLSALLAQRTGSGWILAVGMLLVVAMMIAALVIDPPDDGDPRTTSIIALTICYGLGAAVWFGYAALAVMAGIATTVLLYFKAQLHGMTHRLSPKDLISILQFAVLSFVILPVLPNHDYGPFGTLNPHQIWWMVVLISGVSLAGYAALRLAGSEHGAPVIGFFGGLASSTATTMVFARHARDNADFVRMAAVVILLANLMVAVRLMIETGAVAPDLLGPLGLVLGCGFLLGLVVTLLVWRRLESSAQVPMPEVRNPTELKTALSFGLLYAAVLFLSAWLQDAAGSKGLYFIALASGLTDVDAISLSSLRLFNLDRLAGHHAVIAIALATVSNLIFKSGLVIAIGGRALSRRALPGLVAIGIGIAVGIALLRA
jgi:uncharacterized membrane protein (DUF4010 family)